MLVYGLPIASSLAFVRLATSVVGVPTRSLWVFLLWWLAMSLSATAVVSLVYAVSRRFLPLGALLDLSLVFPDESPSRFRLALRSGTVENLEERLRDLRLANEAPTAQEAAEILLQLAGALDVHDRITRGHAERVRAYSYSLGKQLRLGGDELDRLNWAALLHDIGKLGVSPEILNKPGNPTDEEWLQLRAHPLYGETLVEPLQKWLGVWTGAVGYHHEHWDGSGYPRGIAGEEIPLAGRIVAIADVYDVITSARSYKEPASPTEARAELARCSGTQFDPRLVRAFVNISLGKMRLVMGPLSWLSHAPLLARMPLTPFLGASLGGAAVIASAAVTGITGLPDAAHAASFATRPATPIVESLQALGPVRQLRRRLATVRVRADKSRAKPPATDATRPVSVAGATEVPAPLAPTELSPTEPSSTGQSAEPTTPARVPSTPSQAGPAPAPTPPPPRATPPTPQPPPAPAPTPVPPVVPPSPPAPPAPNAAPSFTAGANQTVLEDTGAQSVAGWATAISPGPVSEVTQNVSFIVSTDNPGLFSVQPAVAPNGTLTYIAAANANGSATITVTASDDGGTANGGADTSAASTVTITVTAVNDTPGFTAGANQTKLEDAGVQTVAGWATGITLGPADEASQTVTFGVSNDTPGLFSVQPAIAADGTLTYIPAANANGLATITVTASDDGGGADTSAASTFTITVTAVNDAPTFTAAANQTTLEDGGAQTVAGSATAITPGPTDEASQTVTFSVANDTPGLFSVQPAVAPDGTLTYTPAANANGLATVTVTAIDDGGGADTSAASTFTITITAVNDAPSFTAGANQITLEDAGTQTVAGWATAISPGPANESAQNISFTVSADIPGLFSTQPAIAANGTLTYTPAANANGSATITVTALDNGGGANTSAPSTATITITAVNDPPSFTAGANQTTLEDAGAQTVAGWATAITPGPADEASQTVTFNVTNDNPGLFTVQPAVAPNGALTYTAATNANGLATVTVTAIDGGGGANTSAPSTATITITAVNDAPSFTAGANQTTLEDAGTQTVAGWATAISAGPANESAQNISFTVSADIPGLFSTQPAIAANGTLTYTPAANANGSATITVTALDDGGGANTSAASTITITIAAVNDTPSFTAGGNQSALSLLGARTVAGWATGITPGPADEASQTVTFSVTNDNPGLFAVQPAVAPNGTLTYTPNAITLGSATVTVRVIDNGGGSDTSGPQTFTITVL